MKRPRRRRRQEGDRHRFSSPRCRTVELPVQVDSTRAHNRGTTGGCPHLEGGYGVALTGSLIVAAYFSALFLLLLLAEWLLESGRADHLRYLHLVFLFRQDPSIEEILPYLDLVEGLSRILGLCLGFRPVLNVPLAFEV